MMSRQLALDTFNLKPTPRLGHTEYSMEYHKGYLRKVTGLDPSDPRCVPAFYDAWDIDMLFGTQDGLHSDWGRRGRVTNMGHAVYAADGSDLNAASASPFTEIEDVWAFDAVAEYGLPSFRDQVRAYADFVTATRRNCPNQLVTGGYYHTIMSGAISAFGWEMLLLGASDLKKMEKVFDSFYRRTLFHMQAWAETDIEVVIQHDDFVWTAGPFLDPAFYRAEIIPRYAELWKPLHAAGKKVLFCSDGNFMVFAEDIVRAGADGLIFEPCNDFGFMAERFGASHALVGSCADCRDMAFAPWETVKATLDRTFELASRCRGVMFAVGNHIPANVPDDMLDRFIAYLKANWKR
jgi:hypothetical protein